MSYQGLWYDGPALAPLEFLRRARQAGFGGVELDGRRPHGSPLDLDQSRRRSIRELCAELDLDVVAIAANNDFSSPVVEHNECQMLMLREQIRLARDLGAPVVRVFLAWPGVTIRDGLAFYEVAARRQDDLGRDATWLESWERCKRALRDACRYAEVEGVVLALQNQPPVIRDHADVLDMIAEVDSRWLRACLDAGSLERQDTASVRQVVQEVGPYQVHSHFDGVFVRRDDGRVEQVARPRARPIVNYPAFVRALREAGYDGYLCFELAHPALDARHQVLGLEYVDEQVALAHEYMQDVMEDADRSLLTVNGGVTTPASV